MICIQQKPYLGFFLEALEFELRASCLLDRLLLLKSLHQPIYLGF
jgi:hypothetical protein